MQYQLFIKIIKDELKLLTFRSFTFDPMHYRYYLQLALVFTWLCGVGRYWDNPKADYWQYFGLGSVAYVFILEAIIWLIILPLKAKHWSYKNVLLFVAMTSPPAILYAIPVEQFMSLEKAQSANVTFLLVVAVWRVALLAWFLMHTAKLSGMAVMVATLLPLTFIVTVLSGLNLEHVVFKIMAGLTEGERSANDAAYSILLVITFFSVGVFPILLALYGWLILKHK